MIKNFTDLNKFSKKELDEIIKIAKKIKKNPKIIHLFAREKL